jgi:signal transduction histidine kinase
VSNGLFKLSAGFVPVSARLEGSELGRARNFVFTHLFGPALGQSISVFLYVTDPVAGPACWTIIACITGFWIYPFALRLTGNLQLNAFLSMQQLVFVTLFGCYEYGGMSSPFLPWLLVALLLGFFYLGEHVLAVLGTFACNILGFYLAYRWSGSFPQHVPLAAMSGVGLISVFSATVYMSWMAIYYGNLISSQSELEREAERHRATASRLRHTTELAEKANLSKSIFLAKMSHELRTPLNAVIGYSEILLEDSEMAGAGQKKLADLRQINAAGKHLLSLVTDVLDLSKIEANTMELSIATFDLNGFVEEVMANSRPLVTEGANTLIVDCPTRLGMVCTDETKLRQAALNLLSNATKFTKRGTITLVVRRDQKANADWIQLEVHDTGIGIAKADLPKLFQNFGQATASTSRKYGGTGLGLALSQKLCALMGGGISVQSEVGRGSCFTIRVPAVLSAEPVTDAEADSPFGLPSVHSPMLAG